MKREVCANMRQVQRVLHAFIQETEAHPKGANQTVFKCALLQVVGPPGTGKTDVAVQIISNIYHNWPEQRTLIVTHSNTALNQLFEKIMHLDIDERHLLRLGTFTITFLSKSSPYADGNFTRSLHFPGQALCS